MMPLKEVLKQPIDSFSFIKRMLIGATIALLLIILFLYKADEPDPQWGKFWMLKPLIIVPLAGAMGGLFYYFMDRFSAIGGLNKIVAIILSFIVYIIGLWLGTILGLDGTWWD